MGVARVPARGGSSSAMAIGIDTIVMIQVAIMPTPPSQPNCEKPRKVADERPP